MPTRIRRSAAPTTPVALIDLAGQLGLELPDAYRDWLLDTNGGVPDRTAFQYRNAKGQTKNARVSWLYPAGRDGLVELTAADLAAAYASKPVGLPARLLPVGNAETDMNTGSVCLMCGGPDAGKVFFRPDVEVTKDTAYPAADSWPGFLAGLMYEGGKPPKPWKQAVWDGDVAALKAILGKGGKWKDDVITQMEIYREVIEEGNWPLTELLLSYPQFEADHIFKESLEGDRLILAAQFLDRNLIETVSPKMLLNGGVGLWHAPPMVKELIARGADPNAEDDDGSTPLHKAVEVRGTEVVEVLLAAGADPTAKDDDGRTPQKLARRLEETILAGRLAAAEVAWKNQPRAEEPELAPFDLKGVTFKKPGPPLTLDEIKAFEASEKIRLPAAYRWLLTQTNGGDPNPGLIPFDRMPQRDDGEDEDEDDEPRERPDIQVEFLPLRNGDGGYPVQEARGWYHDGGEIPRGTLPIATLPGYGVDDQAFLLIGLKGRTRGKLLVYDYGSEKLVDSLAELFALFAELGVRPPSAGERFADAIDAGDGPAAIAILAEGEPIPVQTRDGRQPIEAAAEKGLDDVLSALIAHGHDLDDVVSAATGHGRTAFLRRLVLDGPKKLSGDALRSVLGSPAVYRDPELLAALDARGVKWEKHLKGEHSFLFVAAASGSPDGLRFLLDKGGNANVRDWGGNSLLHLAARSVRLSDIPPVAQAMLNRYGVIDSDPAAAEEMIRLLLDRKAAANQPNQEGYTALHLAVLAGNGAVARRLIDAGENLNAAHELIPAGMTKEQARKQAEKMAKMAEKMFGKFDKLLGGLEADDDDRPVPDTSEPAGERAANLMDTLQQAQAAMASRLPALEAKMAAMATGSWGTGPSAADLGRQHGRAELVAELEAYQAGRAGG